MLIKYLALCVCVSGVLSSAIVVEVLSGDYEDNCGIYPPCKQFGTGSWQILENCHRYINCSLQQDGTFLQYNMACPGDLVFDNEHNDCVDPDRSSDCKQFNEVPCRNQCPRVYLSSHGLALDNKDRLLGCFRLQGSKVGDIFAYYQNMNKFYLTPDATSTPFVFHWLVSEQQIPFSGGLKNDKYPTISCPYDNWDGWEVDTGLGNWAEDETLKTTCHRGDEGATTNAPPMPTTSGQPTQPPQRCHKDGPNGIDNCQEEFLCCEYDTSNNSWKENLCRCSNGLVYDQEFEICTFADVCGYRTFEDDVKMLRLGQSYECEGVDECPGMS